ncbi:MAG TPA: YraN family protein [Thermohalobaculum sp.]|nr:YraN family protein [Thermohalobaculum sp.]
MRQRRGRSAYLSGLSAEDQAARAYLKRGAELLARRHRNAGGEIDLIFLEDGILVFVEVKQRKNPALGSNSTKIVAQIHPVQRLNCRDGRQHNYQRAAQTAH